MFEVVACHKRCAPSAVETRKRADFGATLVFQHLQLFASGIDGFINEGSKIAFRRHIIRSPNWDIHRLPTSDVRGIRWQVVCLDVLDIANTYVLFLSFRFEAGQRLGARSRLRLGLCF